MELWMVGWLVWSMEVIVEGTLADYMVVKLVGWKVVSWVDMLV